MNKFPVSIQKVRFALFYLSVLVFLSGAPFILFYALGYKFDPRLFKFTKAGILVLKTEPTGADVYINGRLKNEKTPLTITGLLPGLYAVEIKLTGHYPWDADVRINSGKVSGYEKIILFPLRPDIKQLNKEEVSSFYLHKENDTLYYFDNERGLIYKSDLEGKDFALHGQLAGLKLAPSQYKISPDRKKVLYFNLHQIGISTFAEEEVLVFGLPRVNVRNVFWHSSGYYLILLTNKNIAALELRTGALPAVLVDLNKSNSHAFYDVASDAVFFQDTQRSLDGRVYENIYKLELEKRIFALP